MFIISDIYEFIHPLIKTTTPKHIGTMSAKTTVNLPHGILKGRCRLPFEKRNLMKAKISNKHDPQLKKLLIAKLSEKSK